MARRWERSGLRLYSRALTPGFGQSEFAILYKAARPVLPDLYWFVARLDSAFLLPPEWAGWPERPTAFADLVRGLRPQGEHGVSDAVNVLDRAAPYVRDDTNELYGFRERPDWSEIARAYAAHRMHPALLERSAAALLNVDAAYWALYTADATALDATETALAAAHASRVERARFGDRELDEDERRRLDELAAAGEA